MDELAGGKEITFAHVQTLDEEDEEFGCSQKHFPYLHNKNRGAPYGSPAKREIPGELMWAR